jgi:Flp pilus assembly pilin Flp
MNKPTQNKSLRNDTRGASTVEYLILLALVAFVGFGVWQTFGGTLKTKGNDANTAAGRITFPTE